VKSRKRGVLGKGVTILDPAVAIYEEHILVMRAHACQHRGVLVLEVWHKTARRWEAPGRHDKDRLGRVDLAQLLNEGDVLL
jgi:hypothetical protein